MDKGTRLQWGNAFGVLRADLPGETDRILREAVAFESWAQGLLGTVGGCPDRELEQSAARLRNQAADCVRRLKDLHHQVRTETD